METLVSILDCPPFNTIADPDLKQDTRALFEHESFGPYTLITETGKNIDRLGFILSGSIDLLSDTNGGYATLKETLEPGDYFGVESLFDRGTAFFDQMTTEQVECLTIEKEDFTLLLSKSTGLKNYFESLLIEKLSIFFNDKALDMAPEKPLHCQDDRRLKKSIDYIDTHYMEGICLDDVAQITGLSRFHFSRLFRQATGHTFKDYLNLKRLEAAKKLLRFPEINISQACFSVGFNDASYFARLFRKYEGISPSFYRKRERISGMAS